MSQASNIELRQLTQFVAVAEELHFRRAASRLGVAQPQLTKTVQRLESEVGAELLDRSQRKVRLTEAGAVLLMEARRTLTQATHSIEAARRAARGQIGSLRVSYVGAAAYQFLPRLIRVYRASHPDVELQLQERTTAAQVRAIQLGEADVGLVRPPLFGANDLHCASVLREHLIAALPADHPLAKNRTIELRDLAGEGFVMFPPQEGPSFHALIVSACEKAGFSMRVAQQAVQMHAIVALVAAGLGVALVPASMRNLVQAGAVYRDIRGLSSSLQVDLAILWRRAEPSSVVTAFLDVARSLALPAVDEHRTR